MSVFSDLEHLSTIARVALRLLYTGGRRPQTDTKNKIAVRKILQNERVASTSFMYNHLGQNWESTYPKTVRSRITN